MLSHISAEGNPAMVDVGSKIATQRSARARAIVELPENLLLKLDQGELHTAKGAVFQTAIIAGVMAAKKTGELIPLCHPIGLDNCQITIRVVSHNLVEIECVSSVLAKTGVEMEALTGASIAALTIYDMCKAVSPDIVIRDICLMEKSGGKKDFKREV